jgi:nucleoid-associated protein YgaU
VVQLPPGSGEAAATPEPPGPGFDTVRLEPDGSGLVAGRAEPGAAVEILAGEEVVAATAADADGRFVAFLSLAPSEAPRALSLRDGAGRVSEETVILAPTAAPAASAQGAPPVDGSEDVASIQAPERAASNAPDDPGATGAEVPSVPREPADGTQVAAADPGPAVRSPTGGDDATGPSSLATDPGAATARTAVAPPTTTAPGAVGPEPSDAAAEPSSDAPSQATLQPEVAAATPGLPSPDAPAGPGQAPVLMSDANGVRVLQPALPSGADAEVLSSVALDAITYGGTGEVVLSGRGSGGTVRLYLDNRPMGEVAIGEDGSWSAELAEAEAGVYTLRLDQLDADGEVVSRIETPFQREERSSLAAAMAEAQEAGQTIAMRTVQPGNTLWAIARDRYGEPLMYVRVFEANRDRIRNPDLIYPGQVFVLPATEGR